MDDTEIKVFVRVEDDGDELLRSGPPSKVQVRIHFAIPNPGLANMLQDLLEEEPTFGEDAVARETVELTPADADMIICKLNDAIRLCSAIEAANSNGVELDPRGGPA